MDYLRSFKGHITSMVPMKEQELRYYKRFAEFLQKYEDGNEKSEDTSANMTGTAKYSVKLITGDSKAHLKNKLDQLASEL